MLLSLSHSHFALTLELKFITIILDKDLQFITVLMKKLSKMLEIEVKHC